MPEHIIIISKAGVHPDRSEFPAPMFTAFSSHCQWLLGFSCSYLENKNKTFTAAIPHPCWSFPGAQTDIQQTALVQELQLEGRRGHTKPACL